MSSHPCMGRKEDKNQNNFVSSCVLGEEEVFLGEEEVFSLFH